ncbi:MAG: putative manganese transporter, partial [Gemmiger sp.]|nr:putative manganese transporter [Gemmiger sp.]
VVFAIVAGFLLDVPLRRFLPQSLYGGYKGRADEVDCHEEHEPESGIFLAALRHTLEIFVFILLFSIIIGLLFGLVGEDRVAALLADLGPLQPVVAALIGLIPNCAASVLLTQLYMQGIITFGSLFAGLCAGAGIGLAVLWRVNPSSKQNLFMTGLLLAAGALAGILLQFIIV